MSEVTKSALAKAHKESGGIVRATAQALGIPESTARRQLKRHGLIAAANTAPPATPHASKASALSLRDFVAKYDKSEIVPGRIKAQLKVIRDGWQYEPEFAKDAGVSLVDLAKFRELFIEHIVITPGDKRRAWFGKVEHAEQMRARI